MWFPCTGKTRFRWGANPYRVGFEPTGLLWRISSRLRQPIYPNAPGFAWRHRPLVLPFPSEHTGPALVCCYSLLHTAYRRSVPWGSVVLRLWGSGSPYSLPPTEGLSPGTLWFWYRVSGQACAGCFHFHDFNTPAGLYLPGGGSAGGQDEQGFPVMIAQHAGIGIGFNTDAV